MFHWSCKVSSPMIEGKGIYLICTQWLLATVLLSTWFVPNSVISLWSCIIKGINKLTHLNHAWSWSKTHVNCLMTSHTNTHTHTHLWKQTNRRLSTATYYSSELRILKSSWWRGHSIYVDADSGSLWAKWQKSIWALSKDLDTVHQIPTLKF